MLYYNMFTILMKENKVLRKENSILQQKLNLYRKQFDKPVVIVDVDKSETDVVI